MARKMRPIRRGDKGPAVEDIQKRLRALGYELLTDGVFADYTERAVIAFRQSEGLPDGNTIDSEAWAALVDATFSLGDRMLYLRMPYFHGCDVRQLQDILNALGFVAGDADGIFGAHTEHALRDFQSSIGLVDDGVAGPSCYDAINRLRHAWEGKAAPSAATDSHSGLARAIEALERVEACFFGMDEAGRDVATRAANVAHATTPFSKINAASELTVAPAEGTLMVGFGTSIPQRGGIPVVAYSEGPAFAQRLDTALSALGEGQHRICIQFADKGAADGEDSDERWRQHVAINILDALCTVIAE